MPESADGGDWAGMETLRGRNWPCLRQFCVFLENRVGRLNDLMRHVETIDTRVLALTVVDSVDFAMVRLVLSNADRARDKLELSGFLFSENDIVGVMLPAGDRPFSALCTALMKAEVNIHNTFPLLFRHRGQSAVAVFVDDVDTALRVLREAEFEVLTEGDLGEDDEEF